MPDNLRITIAGRSYPIKAASSEEQVKKLEEHIDSKYRKLKDSRGAGAGSSFEKDLVLLLINIANDSLEERDKIEYLKKEMLLKIEQLINKVDSVL